MIEDQSEYRGLNKCYLSLDQGKILYERWDAALSLEIATNLRKKLLFLVKI